MSPNEEKAENGVLKYSLGFGFRFTCWRGDRMYKATWKERNKFAPKGIFNEGIDLMMYGVGSENSCGGKTSRDPAGVQERCWNVTTVSFLSGANATKSRWILLDPSFDSPVSEFNRSFCDDKRRHRDKIVQDCTWEEETRSCGIQPFTSCV